MMWDLYSCDGDLIVRIDFLQVALSEGEHLLTSVASFDQAHCWTQDLTISKSMIQGAIKNIFYQKLGDETLKND